MNDPGRNMHTHTAKLRNNIYVWHSRSFVLFFSFFHSRCVRRVYPPLLFCNFRNVYYRGWQGIRDREEPNAPLGFCNIVLPARVGKRNFSVVSIIQLFRNSKAPVLRIATFTPRTLYKHYIYVYTYSDVKTPYIWRAFCCDAFSLLDNLLVVLMCV